MARKVKTVYVGAFIVLCLSLAIGFLFWIGLYRFFKDYKTYVTYFDESVKGLQKDAVVNYRGVPVGRVGEIDIAPDGRLIEVLLHLRPDIVVDEGIVIRLREQGITGLRFLEIDRAPEDVESLTPTLTFTPPYPVIRSYPSEFALLKTGLETLYERIAALNVEQLLTEWSGLGRELRTMVSDHRFDKMVESFQMLTQNLADVTGEMRKFFDERRAKKYSRQIETLLNDASLTLETTREKVATFDVVSLNKSVKDLNNVVIQAEILLEHLNDSLIPIMLQTQTSIEQLNLTIDELRNNPSRVWIMPHTLDPFDQH